MGRVPDRADDLRHKQLLHDARLHRQLIGPGHRPAAVNGARLSSTWTRTPPQPNEQDQKTPRAKLVTDLEQRIRAGTRVILAVRLTRAWQKPGDSAKRHFLQVNNLHLEDDP